MIVAIAGINGFIGKSLSKYFISNGYDVLGIYRNDFTELLNLSKKISQADIILNFSGASIFGLWTNRRKKQIMDSRLNTTRLLVNILNESKTEKLFFNASAVGIYNSIGNHDEFSKNYSNNFLTEVIKHWEYETEKVKNNNIRVVLLRMGIVLGADGGFIRQLTKMLRYKLCIILGNKNNFLPVCSVRELYSIINHIISNKELCGAINVVENFILTNEIFYSALVSIKSPLFVFRINNFLLKIFFGRSSVLFSEGQSVVPKKLVQSDYLFQENNITDLLEAIFK